MISIEVIRQYFPQNLRENTIFDKYLLKEYIQLMMLDFLSTTEFIQKITFIGGTYLRLVKGIDRFSEDLDFDCKDLTDDEFISMTDIVLRFLKKNGLSVELKEKKSIKLKASRRSYFFPELLLDMGLTRHREERFMIKIESQDQLVKYERVNIYIKGCGFFFPFPVPKDDTICAMKLSALLNRQKGRDFYDSMFLLGQTAPDYSFLNKRCGISNPRELKQALKKTLQTVDLKSKMKDFEHLLFSKSNSSLILHFGEFIEQL